MKKQKKKFKKNKKNGGKSQKVHHCNVKIASVFLFITIVLFDQNTKWMDTWPCPSSDLTVWHISRSSVNCFILYIFYCYLLERQQVPCMLVGGCRQLNTGGSSPPPQGWWGARSPAHSQPFPDHIQLHLSRCLPAGRWDTTLSLCALCDISYHIISKHLNDKVCEYTIEWCSPASHIQFKN